jgi:hypothetical protein
MRRAPRLLAAPPHFFHIHAACGALCTLCVAGETRNRIETLRKEVKSGLSSRPLLDDVNAQLDRKVDWERMHDVVGTITEKTVGDYVRANVDRIHREVEVRIQKVFDVDPTMRADMQVRPTAASLTAGCVVCTDSYRGRRLRRVCVRARARVFAHGLRYLRVCGS